MILAKNRSWLGPAWLGSQKVKFRAGKEAAKDDGRGAVNILFWHVLPCTPVGQAGGGRGRKGGVWALGGGRGLGPGRGGRQAVWTHQIMDPNQNHEFSLSRLFRIMHSASVV